MKLLDADEIIEMHDALIKRSGGSEGGGPRGARYQGVEAAAQAVKNSYYQSLAELAAAYAVYIVQGHVFADGNKRTAAAAMTTFLRGNGASSSISHDDLFDAMLEMQVRARSGERTDHLISWLAHKL